jgi:hypothetical protein
MIPETARSELLVRRDDRVLEIGRHLRGRNRMTDGTPSLGKVSEIGHLETTQETLDLCRESGAVHEVPVAVGRNGEAVGDSNTRT